MQSKKNNSAFTLMELMIVIAIIALLVTIMFPSLSAIRERSYKVKSQAAVNELMNAALQYKNATNYYPGQNFSDTSNVTGSQLLAVGLLGGVTVDDSGNLKSLSPTDTIINFDYDTVKSNYIEYSKDRFADDSTILKAYKKVDGKDTWENKSGTNFRLTPLDLWKTNENMAILYFPAKLSNDGETISSTSTTAVFNPNQNSEYGANAIMPTDTSILKDKLGLITGKFGEDKVKNSDSFLIIAPSLDRRYYWNSDDNKCDDITNY